MFHVSRYHTHNLPPRPADQQGAVLVQVGGVAFDGLALAGHSDFVPQRAGKLAPAFADRAEPLGLVEAEPLFQMLEQSGANYRSCCLFSAFHQE